MPKADLVLEGGGVKGVGLVGAISTLEAAGYTFERVAGASAGAVVAAAVAAGVRSDVMRSALGEIGPQFLDRTTTARIPVVGDPLSLALRQGVYKGDVLRNWIAKLLREARFGHGSTREVTFGDLRRAHEEDDDRSRPAVERDYSLVILVADLSRGMLVRLPWDFEHLYGLYPDKQIVADAVRASMSIPFFYVPAHPGGRRTEILVDGGLLSNFPLDIFDRRDGKPQRWPTIGIKLTASPLANQIAIPAGGPLGFVERLVLALMNGNDRMHLDDPEVAKRTIFVDTEQVSPINFDLSVNERALLFRHGEEAAKKFLRARMPGLAMTMSRSAPS